MRPQLTCLLVCLGLDASRSRQGCLSTCLIMHFVRPMREHLSQSQVAYGANGFACHLLWFSRPLRTCPLFHPSVSIYSSLQWERSPPRLLSPRRMLKQSVKFALLLLSANFYQELSFLWISGFEFTRWSCRTIEIHWREWQWRCRSTYRIESGTKWWMPRCWYNNRNNSHWW